MTIHYDIIYYDIMEYDINYNLHISRGLRGDKLQAEGCSEILQSGIFSCENYSLSQGYPQEHFSTLKNSQITVCYKGLYVAMTTLIL